MSPTTGTPRCDARAHERLASATPGLIAIMSTPANSARSESPVVKRHVAAARAGAIPRAGGAARVSAARTRAPRLASQRAIDSPRVAEPEHQHFLSRYFHSYR